MSNVDYTRYLQQQFTLDFTSSNFTPYLFISYCIFKWSTVLHSSEGRFPAILLYCFFMWVLSTLNNILSLKEPAEDDPEDLLPEEWLYWLLDLPLLKIPLPQLAMEARFCMITIILSPSSSSWWLTVEEIQLKSTSPELVRAIGGGRQCSILLANSAARGTMMVPHKRTAGLGSGFKRCINYRDGVFG